MKYSRILSYVQSSIWAIEPSKLHEILSVLSVRADGGTLTKAEIAARLSGGEERTPARGPSTVGVVPIHGTIAHRMTGMAASSGGASIDSIAASFRAALSDPSIGSILFDVDSPGGTVTGVQELADEIYAARGQKPMLALVNGMAASAAYWLASQADEIVSIPSGLSGSIGVFTVHQDLSEHLAKEGIKTTLVSAGKHKLAGHPFAPLSADEEAVIQGRVDAMYATFVKQVARGRGVTPAAVRSGYGEGRALTGVEAKAAGLVDRIATVGEAVERAARGRVGMRADVEDAPALTAETVAAALDTVPAPTLVSPDVETEARRWRVM